MSLKVHVAKGMVWVGLSTVIVKSLSLLVTIILARLLKPNDFGLFGMALLFINMLSLFRDFGFDSALIQTKHDIEKAANTIFPIIMGIGFVLFSLCLLGAPFFAGFYNQRPIESMVRILAFTFIIYAIGVVPTSIMSKKMAFKRLFLPEVGSVIVYAGMTIYFSYFGFGAWSLVYGYFASVATNTLLTYSVCPWRPKWQFNREIARDLFRYGRNVLATSIVVFLLTQGDNLVVGKLLGATALGFYLLAYNISNMPTLNISQVIQKVVFPAYSKLQDDKEKLREGYLMILSFCALLIMPLSIGLFILAPDIITVLLGQKWLPMLPALRVLCIFGLIRPFGGIAGTLINSVGKPEILKRVSTVQLIIMAIIIYPLSKIYGIFGTSLAVTLAIVFPVSFLLYLATKMINLQPKKIIKKLLIPAVSSFLMAIGVYVIKKQILPQPLLVNFIILVAFGVLIYVVSIFKLDREMISDIKRALKEIVNSRSIRGNETSYFDVPREDILPLVPKDCSSVLEIGCGRGMLGIALKQRGIKEVIGIEVDEEMASHAAKNLDSVLVGDVEKIEPHFKEGYFDCIICADVIEHLVKPEKTINKYKEYLKPNGHFIFSIPNAQFYFVPLNLLLGNWKYNKRGILDESHLRFFTLKSIKQLMEECGLKIVDIKRNYRLFEPLCKYQKLAKWLSCYIFRNFLTFQYLVIATK